MNDILYWYDKIIQERIWSQNDSFALKVKISQTWLELVVLGIEATDMNSVSENIVVTRMRLFKHEKLLILLDQVNWAQKRPKMRRRHGP